MQPDNSKEFLKKSSSGANLEPDAKSKSSMYKAPSGSAHKFRKGQTFMEKARKSKVSRDSKRISRLNL
jgi:hypothetical protein